MQRRRRKKKTLKPELSADAFVEPEPDEPEEVTDSPVDEPVVEEFPFARAYPDMPVRLPRLSSLELEHFDVARLDDSYEEKLAITGDDLLPIATAQRIADKLIGVEVARPQVVATNGLAVAAARAVDISHAIPNPAENVVMPELSDTATDEELIEYAKAHPHIRNAMRVFRAKIIEVKRAG